LSVFVRHVFFSPPSWPLSPCFHPHSRGAIRFARCELGVLGSAGAAICWAPWGSAVSEWNLGQAINVVTGTRLWAFVFSLSGTVLIFACLPCFRRLRPRSFGCCCATVRTLLRSPTDDAAAPPAFLRWRRWRASFRFFHHAPPASVPNA
jgi:hypothetical protein